MVRPSDQYIDPTDRSELAHWLADATARFHELEAKHEDPPSEDVVDS